MVATPAISQGRSSLGWLTLGYPSHHPLQGAGSHPTSTKHTIPYDMSKGWSLQTLYPHRWASVDCFSTHSSQTLFGFSRCQWDFPKENVNKHLFVPDRTPTADRRKFHLRFLVSMCVSGIHRSEAGATSRNGERTPTPVWVMTREIRNLGVPSSTCRHQETPGCPAWVLALLEPGSRRLTSEALHRNLCEPREIKTQEQRGNAHNHDRTDSDH